MIMIVLIKLVLLLENACLRIHVFFFPFFFILFWYGRYYFLRYIVIDLIWSFSDLVLLFHQQILSTLCIIFRHFLRLLFMPVLYEIYLLLLLLLRFLNSSGIGSFDLWLFCGRCCIDYLSNFAFLKLPSLYRFLDLLLRRFCKLLGKNFFLGYVCHAMILTLLLWKAILIFLIPFDIPFCFLFLSDFLSDILVA